MTKDEALDIVIKNYKNDIEQDVRLEYCNKVNWNCGECPFRHGTNCVNTIAEKLIERLLKAEEKQKVGWIPCSERLPDKDGEYLASFDNDPIGIIPFNVATHSFGFWDESFDDVGIVVSCNWFDIKPIAWMPLPEPYGGDD